MIRLSRSSDKAALQHLWHLAFGDPPEATEAFFSRLYRPGDALVWDEGGTIASAIYLLDAGTIPGSPPLRASYSYALATLPEFRGRGLGTRMTKAAIARSTELGFDCNLICPAEEGLFSYYTRLGYRNAFSIAEGTVSRQRIDDSTFICRIMSTDFLNYLLLRSAVLPNAATMYPEAFLRYAAEGCMTSGGGLYRLELQGQVGCAAVERRGDRLFVSEVLPASLAEAFTLALLDYLDAETAVFRTASNSEALSPPLRCRPFVLAAGTIPTKGGYFPFVLD